MSKVSFSRELLGTIKFIFDKTKTRTLNATEAYDTSTSQIVLGSFPASATKKLLPKDLGTTIEPGTVPVSGTAAVVLSSSGASGADGEFDALLGKADRKEPPIIFTLSPANVTFVEPAEVSGLTKSKQTAADLVRVSTATFHGNSAAKLTVPAGAATKSNATKDIFYGAITVGTGNYRAWQGKYAVLKVDLLTNKAILRVYNE